MVTLFSKASGFRLALLQFGGLPAYGCLWSATAFPTSSLASSHDRWISRGVLLRTRRPREASGAHWGPWTSFRSPLWKGCSCSLLSRSEPCRPLRCLPICPSLAGVVFHPSEHFLENSNSLQRRPGSASCAPPGTFAQRTHRRTPCLSAS